MSTTNLSEAQLAANRANAQKSTGPVTDAGKETSRRNSYKHGFTGRIQLLDDEERLAYAGIGRRWVEDLRPVGMLEEQLVRMIHDAAWQLNRLQAHQQEVLRKLRIECPEPNALCSDFTGSQTLELLSRYQTRLERGMHHSIDQLRKEQAARARRPALNLTPTSEDILAAPLGGPVVASGGRKDGFVRQASVSWSLYEEEIALINKKSAAQTAAAAEAPAKAPPATPDEAPPLAA